MTNQIDWPRLLGDLQYLLGEPMPENESMRTPVGTPALAKFLDIPRSTVVGYMDGADPKYHAGVRMIAVWCKLSGKGEEFVPVTRATMSAAKVR